jgi:hypothetical protein
MNDENNINTTPEQGQPAQKSTPASNPNPNEKSGVGPIIGSIIVIVLIVLGGLYFWGQKLQTEEPIDPERDSLTSELSEQSDSDEITEIDEDLDSTELDSLDEDLSTIEGELDLLEDNL